MGWWLSSTQFSFEIIKDEIDPVVIRTVHDTQILMGNPIAD
ncbi:MAG: hypothetical protein ACTS8H_04310 [Arsenophonus sp. NC-PE1-MAG3]